MASSGPPHPDLSLERLLAAELGVACVAGLDEAGRGALAGPVTAAAVMLDMTSQVANGQLLDTLCGVRDSKQLSPAVRDEIFGLIKESGLVYGIGHASAAWIDSHGIISATRQAIACAIAQLGTTEVAFLVDGPLRLAPTTLPQRPIVRGDQRSLTIAAASILAKVSRDRIMIDLGRRYPGYGFENNKGYGTVEHRIALDRAGPCPEHRRSFAPLRQRLL